MNHSLLRLTEKISKKPHLVSKDFLEFAFNKLEERNRGEDLSIRGREFSQAVSEHTVSVENGISVIPVTGPLTYEFTSFAFMCGMTTYQSILSNVEKSIELGAHTIVLDVDTPGGEAYACFETAQRIRKMCDQAGVQIISYVDGLSASAGYALTCISDVVVSNPMSKVGSIGVVVGFMNDIPKKIKEGSEAVFIYAGDSKIPYDEEGKVREDWKEEIQQDVDILYEQFVGHVSEMRGLSIESVKETQAKTFRSEQAQSIGLIDEIMTHEAFEGYLRELAYNDEKEGEGMPLLNRRKSTPDASLENETLENEQEEQVEMATENLTQEQLEAQVEAARKEAQVEAQSKLDALEARIKAFEEAESKAALSKIEARVSELSFIGTDEAAGLVSALAEMSSEASESLLVSMEKAQEAVEASVTTPAGDQGDESELSDEDKTKEAVRAKQKQRYQTK